MIASLEDHLVRDNFDLQRGLIARAEGENLNMAQVICVSIIIDHTKKAGLTSVPMKDGLDKIAFKRLDTARASRRSSLSPELPGADPSVQRDVAEPTHEVVEAKHKDGRAPTYVADLKNRPARFCADFGNRPNRDLQSKIFGAKIIV
jgi:hypothetical protein